MFCNLCDMLIHEGEIIWIKVNNEEYPLCPIHEETLTEIKENK